MKFNPSLMSIFKKIWENTQELRFSQWCEEFYLLGYIAM
jgi:hypothetical protein